MSSINSTVSSINTNVNQWGRFLYGISSKASTLTAAIKQFFEAIYNQIGGGMSYIAYVLWDGHYGGFMVGSRSGGGAALSALYYPIGDNQNLYFAQYNATASSINIRQVTATTFTS